MACRGFFECVLKLLNLIVMAVGLAMVGYGAYLLVMWLQAAPLPPPSPSPVAVSPSADLVELGWPPLLLVVDASLPDGTAERLSSAWNRYRQIVHLKRVALYSHLLGPMESMRSPKTRSTGLQACFDEDNVCQCHNEPATYSLVCKWFVILEASLSQLPRKQLPLSYRSS